MDTRTLRTILWLRWRLTMNQWKRMGPANTVVSLIVTVLVCIIGAGGLLAGGLAGFFLFTKASAQNVLVLWDVLILAFLFTWMIGLVAEIQRSETIDIQRLLHLPIALKQVFVINYLASHLTLSIILLLPGMVGLCLGLSLGLRGLMIILLPLVLSFIFAITAWTYCLRGWLVSLMVNPRRRRAIIAGITFTFILMAQLPNIMGSLFGHRSSRRDRHTDAVQTQEPSPPPQARPAGRKMPPWVLTAHQSVPLLWVGSGARSLVQGHILAPLAYTAALSLLGALGLRRAYRTTLRFYQGQSSTRTGQVRPAPKARSAPASRTFLQRRIPAVPQEAGVLALASLRCLTRAPEVKMMVAMQGLFMGFFVLTAMFRHAAHISDTAKPFVGTGIAALTFFTLTQLMFNQFGFDRNGFRSLVLLPAPRQRILLGKNLAFLPPVLIIGLTLLLLVTLILHVPMVYAVCAVLQLLAAFLLLSVLANFASILVPFRIAQGSLKPTKTRPLTTVLIIASHMMFPVLMVPVALIPVSGLICTRLGLCSAGLPNVVGSLLLLSLSALAYRTSLAPLGRLLQSHEQRILDIVTQEVE